MDANRYPSRDEEYKLPGVEALLAGTLALMTGYAQHGADCEIRPLMAGKLVRNLTALANHPALSEPMKAMLTRLIEHWMRAAWQEQPEPEMPSWVHATPVAMQ